ncbi:MAG: 16S rRNA (cytosine(967)-C(5))-methyltransferase RsmB [Bacillota bacterium]
MTQRRRTGGPSTPRQAAVDILTAIEERAAFAGLALDAHLERIQLPAPARGYVTEIVYGVLRWRGTLDWMLAQCSHRPIEELTPAVRNILRLAAYEVCFLDSVPAPVACHAAVELAKARFHPGVASFVNGVCRQLSRRAWSGDWPWPDVDEDPVKALAVRTSHPEWLVARWVARFGVQEARALCEANNAAPSVHVRANILKTTREALAEALAGLGAQVKPGLWAPQALHVRGMGAVRDNPAFQSGLFTVQDEGAQLVAHVLDPQPGERVIDLCAAPGGKTTHLAELMGNEGQVVAVDVHAGKLGLVQRAAARLGITIVTTVEGDGREMPGRLAPADRVLVDAPCSGLGVLRRRPDLRWRKRPEELTALAALQGELLAAAAELTRPGGTLVYSTCTTEPEETTEVVEAFLRSRADFVPEVLPLREFVPDRFGGYLYPHRHGTDGFFIARLRKINT